jgi:hypothetical protein
MNEATKLSVLPPSAPHEKSLAEQETDFTSEGAPAPGLAGTATPVNAQDREFLEGQEDPRQSEELERQQDA